MLQASASEIDCSTNVRAHGLAAGPLFVSPSKSTPDCEVYSVPNPFAVTGNLVGSAISQQSQ